MKKLQKLDHIKLLHFYVIGEFKSMVQILSDIGDLPVEAHTNIEKCENILSDVFMTMDNEELYIENMARTAECLVFIQYYLDVAKNWN